MKNNSSLNNNIANAQRHIYLLESDINSLNTKIINEKEDIYSIKNKISSNLVWNFENKGLNGPKSGKELNGEDDYLFLDPYYDEDGLPTFYINQFNPLFANLYRNFVEYKNSKFKDNGCNPASYTNAFINNCGVHSLIDTIGILSFFIQESNKTGGILNDNNYINILTGKNVSQNSSYLYLEKYLRDSNGNYLFSNVSSSDLLNTNVSEGNFIIKNNANLDQVIDELESRGYIVDLSIGGVSFGPAWGMLGSNSDNGHYGALSYHTNNNISVLDSYGNRAFNYERNQDDFEYLGWTIHQYGENYNEKGKNGNPNASKIFRGVADENMIWHDTTVYLGTNFQSFTELSNKTSVQKNGVVMLTIHKKEE